MTDTKGNGIINTSFEGYEEYKGDISYRKTGSLNIGAGRTGIGQVLCLADIDLNIFRTRIFTDNHTGINLFTRSDKECT